MKFRILLILALAFAGLLLAGSCQREGLESVVEAGSVTYTVKVPQTIMTKAGAEYFTVYYEVYRQAELADLDREPVFRGSETVVGGSTDITFDIVKNQDYTVLFWAQQAYAPYTIDDLRKVTLKSLSANDSSAEAFAGTDEVVKGVSAKGGSVNLVRPVAQINISTLKDGLDMGNGNHTEIEFSEIKIKKLCRVYNVASGAVSVEDEIAYVKAAVTAGDANPEYTPVSMNYVGFIPEPGANVDVDFILYTVSGAQIPHSVANVPVKPNHRTNILGNLVTGATTYNVTVDASWTGQKSADLVEKDGVAKIAATKYETLQAAFDEVQDTETVVLLKDVALTEIAVLAEGKKAVLDLNGFTLSHVEGGSKYVLSNMGSLAIKDSKGSGKVNARGIYNSYNPVDASKPDVPAELTIVGGTFNCMNENIGSVIHNCGVVVLNGGTFNSDKVNALTNEEGSIMTINSGVKVNNCINNQLATLIIHGGEFKNLSTEHIIIAYKTELKIDGGDFVGTFQLKSTNTILGEGYEFNSNNELVKK